MKKEYEIIKLIAFIVFPIIMMLLYPLINHWAIYSGRYDSIPYVSLIRFQIINIVMICMIANIKMVKFKTVYAIITVVYASVLGMLYLVLLPLPNVILNICANVTTHFERSRDIGYLWFGGYLFCLIRVIINVVKSKSSQKQSVT